MHSSGRNFRGFTIVELLVVIVVIGILAAITLVSYTGITQRATAAALTSDLANASKQLKLYQVEHSAFPASLQVNTNCPLDSASTVDINYCLKANNGNTYRNYSSNGTTFSLTETNTSGTVYTTTDSLSPFTLNPTDWLTIGTQVWAKANLNIGTMILGTASPNNDGIDHIEKYCYNNTESNCTANGGLYQWSEAMQYVTTQGAQGICPAGSHIPTDAEWKTLEMQLGMTQAAADTLSWRGTDQGTQLKSGGSSGLNMPFTGVRYPDGSFVNLSLYTYLWSSSESGISAWVRFLGSGYATVYRNPTAKDNGLSVRCLGN